MTSDPDAIELRTHSSIAELGEARWQSLVSPETPPFLSYTWLEALENTGCVGADRGWLPMFLSLWRQGTLLAAAPAYIKGHSMGEFVFDQAWARFSEERLGADYYPKLVVAVPFTPATGPRLLVAKHALASHRLDEESVLAAFAAGLRRLVDHLELSSSHVLFVPGSTARSLASLGFSHRYGVQFHWHNRGYATFDDFVLCFASKRRNQLRRERKELALQGLRLEVLTGSDLTSEVMDHVFVFYKSTVERFFWGRQYLNREFFEEVAAKMPEQLHIVAARDECNGQLVAGAFNLLGKCALYGRYWGATREYRYLHFNVCFYAGIEECIRRGLSVFEPGAGGEHKLSRGFEPTLTHSAHHLRHPGLERAIGDYLLRERQAIENEVTEAERCSVFRRPAEAPHDR
jgi:uncharacterized protein